MIIAKTIMLQGTSSHVGKSILTTALCRILKQDGYSVTPFKAQNMALNSYVTKTGGEMGRAQVAQAEAAGLDPAVEMNPVLLKPTGNSTSQVIIMGRSVGVMSAREYHTKYSLTALDKIKQCLGTLHERFETIVIEGAGSPAEVNLKANDIVNMRIAKLAPAPVLLVADIDRGGALAAVVGTLELLEAEERALVKGIIINKFRGDITLLQPALEFLEQKTGKPVIGVVPHLDQLGIDDEDSVSLDEKTSVPGGAIDIAVLQTPKISNFTDFAALAAENDVTVRYVRQGDMIGAPDLLILPGSKNTTEDLLYLKKQGYADEITALASQGIPIVGICGGYQMLGRLIQDPDHTESSHDEVAGLGLLPAVTTFAADKITHQVSALAKSHPFLELDYTADSLTGYEIHMGRTEFLEPVNPAFTIASRSGQTVQAADGAVSANGMVMGTYLHGIFDNDGYRLAVLNALRVRKGLAVVEAVTAAKDRKEASYDRLAKTVRESLNMNLLYSIMGIPHG